MREGGWGEGDTGHTGKGEKEQSSIIDKRHQPANHHQPSAHHTPHTVTDGGGYLAPSHVNIQARNGFF